MLWKNQQCIHSYPSLLGFELTTLHTLARHPVIGIQPI